MAGARCCVARREKVMATCFALPLTQRPRSIAILTLDHPFSVLVLWISILHPTTPVFNSLFDFYISLPTTKIVVHPLRLLTASLQPRYYDVGRAVIAAPLRELVQP